MTDINPAIENFIQACVADGIDDWIPPREVYVNARMAAERIHSSTQEVLLEGLARLIDGEYVEVGDVVKNISEGGLVFQSKGLTKDESLAYLRDYYANDTDPNELGFEFWLNLTKRGELLAGG